MSGMDRRHARPSLPERQIVRLSTNLDEAQFEVREATAIGGHPTVEVEGYAAVFDYEYEMYSGPPYGWIERIRPGAFDETLADGPDVVFLVNHRDLPLARSKSETLTLSVDDHGLLMRASLALEDPDVAALVPKMKRKDVTEMSFAFRVTEQLWRQHDDYEEDTEYPPARDITKVNINRGDVSVVTFGASDATEIDFRQALDVVGRTAIDDPEQALAELRSRGWSEDLLPSVIEAARRDAGGTSEDETGTSERDASGSGGMPIGRALEMLDD